MSSSPSSSPPDPWTTDQESALLRAIVTFKPIGLHAHFRMLAIHHYLLQSGTTDPNAPHTRIPGIWTKLRQLYDLEGLDEREDVVLTGLDEGTYWRDFELDDGGGSGGGFGEMMWERRLKPGGSDRGSEEGDGDERERDVTAGETTATDEPRSSPVPSAVGRGTRSGRKGRVSKLKDEMEVDSSPSGRGSRRASKAASEVDDDQNVEDAEDEEGSEDEEIEDSDEEQEESEKRGSIARRGRGGRRGRGKRGRRRG